MADKSLASFGGTLQVNPAMDKLTGSEDESQRGQQQSRKRTARACDSCYKRKVLVATYVLGKVNRALMCGAFPPPRCSLQIKCDAAVPQCNWCSHHNIPCTFERTIQKKRREKSQGPGYVVVPIRSRAAGLRLIVSCISRQQKSNRLSERLSRVEKLLMDNFLSDSRVFNLSFPCLVVRATS